MPRFDYQQFEGRVESILSKMTLAEKVGQMTQYDFGFYNINNVSESSNSYGDFVKSG
jgi:hypothetical protein